jgi:hypothetical protein
MILITLTFISFTRIFFRSRDLQTVESLMERMQNNMGLDLFFDVIKGYSPVFTVIALGYIIHWIPEATKARYRNWFAGQHFAVMGGITVLLVFVMYQLMSGEMQPFIYFQF